MPDTLPPEVYGTWTVISQTASRVVTQCACGEPGKFPASTWRAKKGISQMCRRCLIRREKARFDKWFLKPQ